MNSLKDYATECKFSVYDLMRCERRLTSAENGSEFSIRAIEGIAGIASNFDLNLFDTFNKVYEFCKNSKK